MKNLLFKKIELGGIKVMLIMFPICFPSKILPGLEGQRRRSAEQRERGFASMRSAAGRRRVGLGGRQGTPTASDTIDKCRF